QRAPRRPRTAGRGRAGRAPVHRPRSRAAPRTVRPELGRLQARQALLRYCRSVGYVRIGIPYKEERGRVRVVAREGPRVLLAGLGVAVVVWLLIKAAQGGSTFLQVTLNGITLAALYFVVAAGFTLIFGLMRVVNMAHGSLY